MHEKYKIAIIGLGSIGKRHLSNIKQVLESRGSQYTIDLIRRYESTTIDNTLSSLISNVYTDFDNVPDNYDVIFVTNPTHLHYETIKKFSSKCKNMFIEKPIFDDPSVNLSEIYIKPDGIYYVACPLRYTEVIQYVRNYIDINCVHSARAICSSYLPEWRPGVDYRTTYSAHLDQGGGVSIDLIHEWDYMMYLFGLPKQIMNIRGKFSKLDLNSDDISVYIAGYDNMIAEIHLDYFGRKSIRELQLITSEDTIVADLLNSEIRYLKENRVIHFNEDRNSYCIKEIDNFFDVLEGKKTNENDIYTALSILKIAKDGKF